MKLTWWLEKSPTRSLAALSDEALLATLSMTESLCVLIRKGDWCADDKLPAVGHMWKHNPLALHIYGMLASIEADRKRGFNVGSFAEFNYYARQMSQSQDVEFEMPPWWEDEDIMKSHASAAMREKALDDGVLVGHHVDEFWPVLWPMVYADRTYDLHISKKDKAALEIDDLALPDSVRSRVVNL